MEVPTYTALSCASDYNSKYHSYECCDDTRGTDKLLARYTADRNEIDNLVSNDPGTLIDSIWQPTGPLAIDNNCRCRMGKGDIRSAFSCAQCKNLRRVVDFKDNATSRPFTLQCGKDAGRCMIAYSDNVAAPFLQWDEASALRSQLYVEEYRSLLTCGTPDITGMRCVTGDTFTIRTLVSWMVQQTLGALPHYNVLHTAFICRSVGYSLYDNPSIGNMFELHKIKKYHVDPSPVEHIKAQSIDYAPLSSAVTRTIVMQLIVALSELRKIHFSHGSPSIASLVFEDEPVSYSYNKVKVTGPVTLKLINFWNSSMTVNNVHYFSKNSDSELYLARSMFAPNIVTRSVTECASNTCATSEAQVYRLTNSTIHIFNAMRHIGFPLYIGSFDFYCFMISLMCDISFYESLMKDSALSAVWNSMWQPEDLPGIVQQIKIAHEMEGQGISIEKQAVDILRGAWLRCDILDHVWNKFK
jgi:hypothetical protein